MVRVFHSIRFVFLPLCLSFTSLFATERELQPVKVACVGNSITYGALIQDREFNSYPAQLSVLLGDGYEVKNFGVSGSTLLNNGDHPYMATEAYDQSLRYQPDIVFIKLGTNDSKPWNRTHLSQFNQDYLRLIDSYRQLPSHPRVILLTPLRSFLQGDESISEHVIQTRIIPEIEEIAYQQDLEVVNLHNLFGDQWDESLIPDKLHPSSLGAGHIASKLHMYLAAPETVRADVVNAFPLKPVSEFNYHGYRGCLFNDNGVEYYIVKPYRVAQGNPWIWRARFWGHEPQVEIELLERGFHLTYCDVANLYGADEAVKRWDRFYALAVQAGLHEKVVLEGMSRGGLIIYNWAAANVEKVACIYADAPVMDFKSWPMGKGTAPRSEVDTERLLSAYGFRSEEEALQWGGNPIDHAAILAKAGIPMLHVVGEEDKVVPVSENTALFAKRLAAYHYKLNVINKPGIGHHPHSLNNPEPIVRFILRATGLPNPPSVHPVPGNETVNEAL